MQGVLLSCQWFPSERRQTLEEPKPTGQMSTSDEILRFPNPLIQTRAIPPPPAEANPSPAPGEQDELSSCEI